MAKKIIVNKDLCIGCGACVNLYPGIFELDSDGKSSIIIEKGCVQCDYERVINSCPVGAIKIEEE